MIFEREPLPSSLGSGMRGYPLVVMVNRNNGVGDAQPNLVFNWLKEAAARLAINPEAS